MREDDLGFCWQVEEPPPSEARRRTKDFRVPAAPDDYVLPVPVSLEGAKIISIDCETVDPNIRELGPGSRRKDGSKLVGFSLRTDDGRGDYYPLQHTNGPNLPMGETLKWLDSQIRGFCGTITGANLLYDFDWFTEQGVTTPKHAKIKDVQWAEPLLDENKREYNLQALCDKYLDVGKITEELERRYGRDYIEFMDQVHPGHMRAYAMGDVDRPLELLPILEEKLLKDGDLLNDGDALLRLYELECSQFQFLIRMRQLGTRVDMQRAEALEPALEKQIQDAIADIKRDTGFTMTPSAASPEVAMLFGQEGIPFPINPETNKPSIRAKWLEVQEHPLAQKIVSLRQLSKFKGTFVSGYLLKHAIDDRIHCLFHPLKTDKNGTVSGRYSSSAPNLQNIPTRHPEIGPLCRSIFIPRDGRKWWSRDYSQIEYRFLVHEGVIHKCQGAQEAADAYRKDPKTDFHEVASRITGVPRKQAKNINFGVAYGMGEATMAANLGVPLGEAKEVLATFHEELPFLKQIYNKAMGYASRTGIMPTILRRRRRYDLWEPTGNFGKKDRKAYPLDIAKEQWPNKRLQRAFCNTALNARLQGSAADLMKKAMSDAWHAGLFDGTGVDCTLTVHDELDGDSEDTPRAREALRELDHVMATAIELTIPVMAEGKEGANWHDAKS